MTEALNAPEVTGLQSPEMAEATQPEPLTGIPSVDEDDSLDKKIDDKLEAEQYTRMLQTLDSVPTPTGARDKIAAKEASETSDAEADITARLAANDLGTEPTAADLEQFKDRDFVVNKLGKVLNQKLVYSRIDEFQQDFLDTYKALDPKHYKKLEQSKALEIVFDGLKQTVKKVVDNPKEYTTAHIRKYLTNVFVGLKTPEVKVNQLFSDLEDIIHTRIAEDDRFPTFIENFKFDDGISQKEYDKFMSVGGFLIRSSIEANFDQDTENTWEAVTRAFRFPDDSDHIIEEAFWDLPVGTFLGNSSPFNMLREGEEFKSGFSKRVQDNPGLLSVISTLGSLFYTRGEKAEKMIEKLDKKFGKGVWQEYTTARFVREIAVAFGVGKFFPSSATVSGLSKLGSKLPSMLKATKISPMNARAAQTAAVLALDGAMFSAVDVGLDVAILKGQGKELTEEVIEKLEVKLLHMLLMSGGMGVIGGVFSLAKSSGIPQKGAKALRDKLVAWTKSKGPEWLALQFAHVGPNVLYTAAQRMPYLFPEGSVKLQKYIQGLRPGVFTKDTLRQVIQAAQKTGHPPTQLGEGPIGLLDSPELITNMMNDGTVTAAARNLTRRKEYELGDFAHALKEVEYLDKTAFPLEANKSLIAAGQRRLMKAMGKYKAASLTNLSPFTSEMFGKERYISNITRKVGEDFHKAVLPKIQSAKNRQALTAALHAGNQLGRNLTPQQLVGELGVHAKDVPKYYAIRGAFDDAWNIHNTQISNRLNQDGWRSVKGQINEDFGSELVMKPFTARNIFGDNNPQYTLEGIKSTVAGKEFSRYLGTLNEKAASEAIEQVAKGKVFGVMHDLNTGQNVLRKGVRGILAEVSDVVPVSQPWAKLDGYFPGFQAGEHLAIKINNNKLQELAKLGGTEGGKDSGVVSVVARGENYSIGKAHVDKLNRENVEIGVEHILIDTGSPGFSQITARQEFFTAVGEDTAETGMVLINQLRGRLNLEEAEASILAETLSRASMNPTLRSRGQPVEGFGKAGAMEFAFDKEGKITSRWNPNTAPYLNTSNASHKYLSTLAREIGEKDFQQATRKYFLNTYGEKLSNQKDVYSNVIESKLTGTGVQKSAELARINQFQKFIAMQELRGKTPALTELGHKIVEGAKVANDRLAETHSPLHHLTSGLLDSIIRNPNLPSQFVHKARQLTSIRLFFGSLRVAATQLLPAIENITYSIPGPTGVLKNPRLVLEPLGVAKDALEYFANIVSPMAEKQMGLVSKTKSGRRMLDIRTAIEDTRILSDLRMATPGGADGLVGNSYNPIYQKVTEASDNFLYGMFRAGEGINRLIAGTATYRRMEITRDVILKQKVITMTPNNKIILSHWKKLENGDQVLTKAGKEALGNEARLIAGDMAEAKNFPMSNRGTLGLAFQYTGILAPRLLERYLPWYGNTFSPGRQAWNVMQISAWMGIGGPAFALEAIELYQNVMNKIIGGPRPPGRVVTERTIQEAAQVLADLSNITGADVSMENWNKFIRDGGLGQHLSKYPGDVQKFLPSRMFSEFVGNYVREGVVPINILKSIPAVSQLGAAGEGASRAYDVLKNFAKGLPEEGFFPSLRDPETRSAQFHDLGNAFGRAIRAGSYRSGVSSFITALEVYGDDFDGRVVNDNEGRPVGIPFPGEEDAKFKNFLSIWAGVLPGASDEITQLGTLSNKARKEFFRDAGRIFWMKRFDTKDEAASDEWMNSVMDLVEKEPDAPILVQHLIEAVVREGIRHHAPAIDTDLLRLARLLSGNNFSATDIPIIQGLLKPVEDN